MTPEQIEEMYERLPTLVVELAPDPTARGPAHLQSLISQVRGYLNQTGIYIQRVLKAKAELESELEAQQVAFQISADELLAEDRRVTRLPAIRDREAMINFLLSDDRKTIMLLTKQVNDIGYVEKAVRHRHRELEHTMSAIRLQRSLIQTELKTGSLFGDEGEESRGSTWGRHPSKDEDIDEEEIDRLMDEAEAEGEDEEGNEAEPAEPEVADEPTEDEDEEEDEGEDEGEDEEEDEGEGEDEDEDEEDDLLSGLDDLDDDVALGGSEPLLCSVCGEPQKETDLGLVCSQGHGAEETPPAKDDAKPSEDPGLDESDLFGEPEATPEPTPEPAAPAEDEPEDPDIANFLEGEDDFSDIFGELGEDG